MNEVREGSGVHVWRLITAGAYEDTCVSDEPYPRLRLLWSYPLNAFVWEIQDGPGVEMKYIRACGAEETQDRVFDGVARPRL